MLDGVYRLTDGVPLFQAIPAPTTEQLQAVLTRIITRLLTFREKAEASVIQESEERVTSLKQELTLLTSSEQQLATMLT